MKKKTVVAVTEPECPWETGELGNSVEHAKPVSREHDAAVDESLGLQMISIRLQKALIEDLKYFAEREGLGYQPLIRRILMRYVSHEYKAIAREQFAGSGAQAKQGAKGVSEPCEELMAAAG